MNKTTPTITNVSILFRDHPIARVAFKCCDCGAEIVWNDHEFNHLLEVETARRTPAVWLCDECDATAAEIFANRNAGI